jgi:FMN phosphatase YigB (HAD superfamily)
MAPIQALVLDLGNVVFTWSSEPPSIPNAVPLKAITKTTTWADYECGLLTTMDCYSALGEKFGVRPSDIGQALVVARDSLVANDRLLAFIRELKHSYGLSIYAMSNISRADIDYLREKHGAALKIFDGIFASGYVGMRKPDEGFYRHVIARTGHPADRVAFLDDRKENVQVACLMGMLGLCYDEPGEAYQWLRNSVSCNV